MARALRIEFRNAVYHITARGNERRAIFRDTEDYKKLIEIFEQAKLKYILTFYCYGFMPNHYHLMIGTPWANLTKVMHFIQTKYTIYFNRKYNRVGHLFQGRYKAILVDKNNYLLELSRYIHLNPLRAKLADRVEDYKWTSFNEYIGLRKSNFVDTEAILEQFDKKESIAQRKYKEFCYQGRNINWKRFKKEIYGGVILGTKEFVESIKEKIKELKLTKEIPLNRKLRARVSKKKLLEVIGRYYNKSIDEICSKQGEARKIAIYLLRKYTDMDLKMIADLFGSLHYSSISKVVSRLALELKDNKILNTKLCQIEKGIQMSNVKI